MATNGCGAKQTKRMRGRLRRTDEQEVTYGQQHAQNTLLLYKCHIRISNTVPQKEATQERTTPHLCNVAYLSGP